MADLSFDEKALLRALALEILKAVVKWMRASDATGAELSALIAKAEQDNTTNIFDLIGKPPADEPPPESDIYSVVHDGLSPTNPELIALGFKVGDWVGESKDRSLPQWCVVHYGELMPRGIAYVRDIE